MKDNSAIKPNFFFNQLPSLQVADNEAAKRGASEEERALHAMSQSKGWLLLKEIIEHLKQDLSQVNKTAIESGAPLEEIGRNTIVISLTQDILEKVLNKVQDATEACVTNENEQ